MPEPFGFINAFKPPGPSSTAFGAWVRRLFGGRTSGGHWGTLDPGACGVLVIAIGEATKLLTYLGEGRKQYLFELRVGTKTSTADAGGRVVDQGEVPGDWPRHIAAALPRFVGDLEQTPPMFSAVKVDGRPLYRSARRGEDVARPKRRVRVYSLDALRVESRRAILRVVCSPGTYVRVLCEDLAAAGGTLGHMGVLVREAAGAFVLSDAALPAQLAAEPQRFLIDPGALLEQPRVQVGDDDARRFEHGNPIVVEERVAGPAMPVPILVYHGSRLLGVGERSPEDAARLVARRVLRGALDDGANGADA